MLNYQRVTHTRTKYTKYLSETPCFFTAKWDDVYDKPMSTWWLIPRLISGLYNPSYKWINPTYPIYNWGYNPLTSRGVSHQVHLPHSADRIKNSEMSPGSSRSTGKRRRDPSEGCCLTAPFYMSSGCKTLVSWWLIIEDWNLINKFMIIGDYYFVTRWYLSPAEILNVELMELIT